RSTSISTSGRARRPRPIARISCWGGRGLLGRPKVLMLDEQAPPDRQHLLLASGEHGSRLLAARRHQPASVLSGGEQQMLALGRGLLVEHQHLGPTEQAPPSPAANAGDRAGPPRPARGADARRA